MTNIAIPQVIVMASAFLMEGSGNTSEIDSLTQSVNKLTDSVDLWNRWMIVGLVAAALAALWVLVATRLTIVRGKQLSVAQSALASAKDRQFQLDLASAQSTAAKANETAEGEKLARVRLEESMAWRRLSDNQRTAVAERLAHFSVTRTWFLYNNTDIEAYGFAADIARAIKKWNPTEPEPIMKLTEGPVPVGTIRPPKRGVFVSTTGEENNNKAADALVNVLRSFGFDAYRSSIPPIRESHPTSTVFVMVEPRPEGPQSDAKQTALHENP